MKKKKHAKAKIKKAHIRKVHTPEPGVHVIETELVVECAPELPQEPIPDEPIDLGQPQTNGWGAWLKSLWS